MLYVFHSPPGGVMIRCVCTLARAVSADLIVAPFLALRRRSGAARAGISALKTLTLVSECVVAWEVVLSHSRLHVY